MHYLLIILAFFIIPFSPSILYASGGDEGIIDVIKSADYLTDDEKARLIRMTGEMEGLERDNISEVINRSIELRFSPDEVEGLMDVLRDTERSGIPSRTIINKILEGMAKGRRGEEILRASQRVLDALKKSKEILDRAIEDGGIRPDPSEKIRSIEKVGLAIRKGMPVSEVGRMVNEGLAKGRRGIDDISEDVYKKARQYHPPMGKVKLEIPDHEPKGKLKDRGATDKGWGETKPGGGHEMGGDRKRERMEMRDEIRKEHLEEKMDKIRKDLGIDIPGPGGPPDDVPGPGDTPGEGHKPDDMSGTGDTPGEDYKPDDVSGTGDTPGEDYKPDDVPGPGDTPGEEERKEDDKDEEIEEEIEGDDGKGEDMRDKRGK